MPEDMEMIALDGMMDSMNSRSVVIMEGKDKDYEDMTIVDYHTHYTEDGELVGPAMIPHDFMEGYQEQYPGFKLLPKAKEQIEGMEKADKAREELDKLLESQPKIKELLNTIEVNNRGKHSSYG